MPKIKTKRAAAKRFKKTGTGKFIHFPQGKSHLLTHKSRKRKRALRHDRAVSPIMGQALRRMLPYL